MSSFHSTWRSRGVRRLDTQYAHPSDGDVCLSPLLGVLLALVVAALSCAQPVLNLEIIDDS
jgi:hypothetical protein